MKRLFNRRTLLILLFVTIIFHLMGYRITGYSAAKVHFDVSNDAQLVEDVKFDWGTVYLFDTKDGPETVLSERKIILWKASTAFHMKETSSKIQLIGYGNNEKSTVYGFKVIDEKVSYIEMGRDKDKVQQTVDKDEIIIFRWDKSIPWNYMDGKAYSKEGKVLYRLGYPEGNTVKPSDLGWY